MKLFCKAVRPYLNITNINLKWRIKTIHFLYMDSEQAKGSVEEWIREKTSKKFTYDTITTTNIRAVKNLRRISIKCKLLTQM